MSFELERDRFEDQAKENKRQEELERQQRADEARRFAESEESATPISEIVLTMMENECYAKIFLKQEIYLDMSVSEAYTEACIQLGLSDEELSPAILDGGNEIEIFLSYS